MSLQDDIFDVEDVLDGKPEAEAFARVLDRFNLLEKDLDKAHQRLNRIVEGIHIFHELFNISKQEVRFAHDNSKVR